MESQTLGGAMAYQTVAPPPEARGELAPAAADLAGDETVATGVEASAAPCRLKSASHCAEVLSASGLGRSSQTRELPDDCAGSRRCGRRRLYSSSGAYTSIGREGKDPRRSGRHPGLTGSSGSSTSVVRAGSTALARYAARHT